MEDMVEEILGEITTNMNSERDVQKESDDSLWLRAVWIWIVCMS